MICFRTKLLRLNSVVLPEATGKKRGMQLSSIHPNLTPNQYVLFVCTQP